MRIRTDDVLNDLKTYEDYEFNTILSDMPYNLGSEWVIGEDGSYQIKGKASDFMNKWEGLDGPSLDTFFKESFRTMKHGGYLLMFGMDRQLGPLHYYATKNGFEINQSLYWYFVSNFPKSTDASKQLKKRIDKKGGKEELVDIFDGYKYSKAPLKQMVETICVFSKPTKNKSVLDDLIEWGESVDLLNYSPKVSKKERKLSLDEDEYSTHPTMKPMKLIKEIFSLFKLPEIVNQKVYVPFGGVFSEVIAIASTGLDLDNITVCEMNEDYVEQGKKRLKKYLDENED